MYPSPHLIWVAGFVRQSLPALAIFEPGSAWGMPYAPEEGFEAEGFQPLSRCQRLFKQDHWSSPHPWLESIPCAIPRGDSPEWVAPLDPPLLDPPPLDPPPLDPPPLSPALTGAGSGLLPPSTTSSTGSAPTASARTSSPITSPPLVSTRLVIVRSPDRPLVSTFSVPLVSESVSRRVVLNGISSSTTSIAWVTRVIVASTGSPFIGALTSSCSLTSIPASASAAASVRARVVISWSSPSTAMVMVRCVASSSGIRSTLRETDPVRIGSGAGSSSAAAVREAKCCSPEVVETKP